MSDDQKNTVENIDEIPVNIPDEISHERTFDDETGLGLTFDEKDAISSFQNENPKIVQNVIQRLKNKEIEITEDLSSFLIDMAISRKHLKEIFSIISSDQVNISLLFYSVIDNDFEYFRNHYQIIENSKYLNDLFYICYFYPNERKSFVKLLIPFIDDLSFDIIKEGYKSENFGYTWFNVDPEDIQHSDQYKYFQVKTSMKFNNLYISLLLKLSQSSFNKFFDKFGKSLQDYQLKALSLTVIDHLYFLYSDQDVTIKFEEQPIVKTLDNYVDIYKYLTYDHLERLCLDDMNDPVQFEIWFKRSNLPKSDYEKLSDQVNLRKDIKRDLDKMKDKERKFWKLIDSKYKKRLGPKFLSFIFDKLQTFEN